MLSQRAELLDGREHVNQFLNAFAEQVELAKNVALIEIKLLHFGLGRKLFFGDAVLFLVGLIQTERRMQVLQQGLNRLIPESTVLHHVLLALRDHLICDLAEKYRHALGCTVITRNCQHHLGVVHQAGQSLNDLLRFAVIQGLCVFVQCRQVFHVVFGLIERVGDTVVNVLPALEYLRLCGGHDAQHHAGLFRLELLRHAVELGHPVPPERQLAVRPGVIRVARRLLH